MELNYFDSQSDLPRPRLFLKYLGNEKENYDSVEVMVGNHFLSQSELLQGYLYHQISNIQLSCEAESKNNTQNRNMLYYRNTNFKHKELLVGKRDQSSDKFRKNNVYNQ